MPVTILSLNDSLQIYRASRDALLAEIIQTLSTDERFVAAWLAGSFGRNGADEEVIWICQLLSPRR